MGARFSLGCLLLVVASACAGGELDEVELGTDFVDSCEQCDGGPIFQYYGQIPPLGGLAENDVKWIDLPGISDEHWNIIDFTFMEPTRAQTWAFDFETSTLPPGAGSDPTFYGYMVRVGGNAPLDDVSSGCQTEATCYKPLSEPAADECLDMPTCSTAQLSETASRLQAGINVFEIGESAFAYNVEPGSETDDTVGLRMIVGFENQPQLGTSAILKLACTDGCEVPF
jgi:hypothetical protein